MITDWSLVTSRVAVPRASGRSCTPSKGRCPPNTHTPPDALQRPHPAVSPRSPARGRCSPGPVHYRDSARRWVLGRPPGVAVPARTPAEATPPRPVVFRRPGGSRLHTAGPRGRGGCPPWRTRPAARRRLLGDAPGRAGARSRVGLATPPASPRPQKRQLRGAGAASRHLPRPPRRRPAPQPRRLRGVPRLPASPAGGSVPPPPPPSPGMNIMDFNVKKLAADAGTFLSRAVQVRRRRLRTGRWRRGGRGGRRRQRPGLLLGAAWRPGPAGRFRFALPNRRSAPSEASPDAAPSVRHPGHLGLTPGRRPRCPGGRARAGWAPLRHPHPSLGSPSPSGPRPRREFPFPALLPALFPPELSSPCG